MLHVLILRRTKMKCNKPQAEDKTVYTIHI